MRANTLSHALMRAGASRRNKEMRNESISLLFFSSMLPKWNQLCSGASGQLKKLPCWSCVARPSPPWIFCLCRKTVIRVRGTLGWSASSIASGTLSNGVNEIKKISILTHTDVPRAEAPWPSSRLRPCTSRRQKETFQRLILGYAGIYLFPNPRRPRTGEKKGSSEIIPLLERGYLSIQHVHLIIISQGLAGRILQP